MRSGKWTSKGQYTETYETYFGKAEVKRHVYQSSEGGKTYCPLEEKAQLIEGATPKFAKTLSSKYAHLGVGQVTADLLDNHGRSISATYVQRVSDAVGLLLTTKGERWQYALPDDLDKRSEKLRKGEDELESLKNEIRDIRTKQQDKLEKVAKLTRDEAKAKLMEMTERDVKHGGDPLGSQPADDVQKGVRKIGNNGRRNNGDDLFPGRQSRLKLREIVDNIPGAV